MLLLKSQPDVGMLAVITAVFFAQLYVDGLNLFAGRHPLIGPAARRRRLHVVPARAEARGAIPASRHAGNDYQVTTALEAFGNGGLLGRGPGEGR